MVTATRPRIGLALAAVIAVWSLAWLAVAEFHARPPVAIGAAFDFVVTANVVLWFVSRRRVPRWMLGMTISIGLVFARLVLGASSGHAAIVLGLTLELAVLVAVLARGRRARAAYRGLRTAGEGGLVALAGGLEAARVPARVASVVAAELYVMAMVVAGWRRPAPAFTVHRANGWSLYATVLVCLVLVETAAVHIALAGFVSTTAAWIVTALSIYSALWLAGDALALRHGGLFVRGDELELRIGARWRARIARADIVAIEGASADALDLSILGANTTLRLRAPVIVHGLFGRTRTATAIALSLDDRDGFVRWTCLPGDASRPA